MPNFSDKSKATLSTADSKLQTLFNEVIKYYDCTIICGHRGQAEQDAVFASGKSKLKYPKSKHNTNPARAVDVAPSYTGKGIPWEDREKFILFAGFVLGVASQMGIDIVWGGDWDSDKEMKEHSFWDAPHFELID